MPILWIEESSPLTVAVKTDDGEVLNSMEVNGVEAKDAVWRLTEVKNPAPSNPVYQKGFRMRPVDADRGEVTAGSRHVLEIEFQPESD